MSEFELCAEVKKLINSGNPIGKVQTALVLTQTVFSGCCFFQICLVMRKNYKLQPCFRFGVFFCLVYLFFFPKRVFGSF